MFDISCFSYLIAFLIFLTWLVPILGAISLSSAFSNLEIIFFLIRPNCISRLSSPQWEDLFLLLWTQTNTPRVRRVNECHLTYLNFCRFDISFVQFKFKSLPSKSQLKATLETNSNEIVNCGQILLFV